MESILFAELTLTEQETLRGGKDNRSIVIYNINNNTQDQSQSQSQTQQQQQQQQGFLTTTTMDLMQKLV